MRETQRERERDREREREREREIENLENYSISLPGIMQILKQSGVLKESKGMRRLVVT